MAYSHFERLSALDATFLELEDPNVHMHVGAVAIFEAEPLMTPEGSLDIERILSSADSALLANPRFRQRLTYAPLLGHPAWIDDEHFNLRYHIRHSCLPLPGDTRILKRMAGRILSQQLDRGKPLWEMWFIEGLEGNRFAVITKAHHCMIDGVSGVDLMGVLMRTDPDPSVEPAGRWFSRPAPPRRRLLTAELIRRASLPLTVLRAGHRAISEPRATLDSAREILAGLGEAISAGLSPASATPLNPTVGPHRRFDWARCELDAVKEIGQKLGGTVNDVVLTTASGALGRFLQIRGLRPRDLDFRSLVPVSVRTRSQRGTLGNRISFLLARLPIDERDPRKRMKKVIAATTELKESKQVLGAEIIEEVSDWTLTTLFAWFSRLGAANRIYNTVVTNVPGPQQPVYLLGARMLEIYPLAPLFRCQALSTALFSYDGGLFWGFNADRDALPDLHDLVDLVESEFDLLRKAAAPTRV
jgi:WS/DGAT/MGAT family acyltransferase